MPPSVPSQTPPTPPERVVLARVLRPHGVRGAVRCRLYAENADLLGCSDLILEPGGRRTRARILSENRGHALCTLDGVTDRTAAEELAGAALTVARDRLPTTEAGTYYHTDLIGLAVRDSAGRDQGTVVAVHNFGAGDLLEVEPPEQSSVFVPFTSAAVSAVDPEAGVIEAEAVWFEPGRNRTGDGAPRR